MAFSTVDVHIQNPARAGKGRKKVAQTKRRKLSAKQIKAGFGGKRRKSAAKSSRPKHRARTRPNPPRKKRRRAVAKAAPVRRKKRAVAKKASPRKRRKNPTPMIISWAAGNPAGGKKVARRRKKRATAKRRTNAGRRSAPKKVMRRSRRRSNPGALGNPMQWAEGGIGVVFGAVGSRMLPQMLLSSGNSGAMGYLANIGAAIGLGYLSHVMFPRRPALATGIVAGGVGATISRAIADRTPFGAQFSLSGLGDWGLGLYQKSNYPYPPRLQGGVPGTPQSSNFTWGDGSQPVTSANYGSDSSARC